MALHSAATGHRSAHSRGHVGAVRALVGLMVSVAAVAGVGAAATSAVWGGAAHLGPSSSHVATDPVSP